MPALRFSDVTKAYGPQTVIKGFDAVFEDGEFLVLLGPSGCGKSTMLRMIAGLTEISGGQIAFDDTVVNDLTPKQRNIAFVFQSYALYPHMTVRENVAFPLVMDQHRWWHHIPIVGPLVRRSLQRRPDIAGKVEEVARTLELTDYLHRRPKELSGGQRQRVAVARSLVREPSLYLLDEPLSNLDAKLRSQMRAEIATLHRRVQKTFVYVTHDQVEAMTMGTKIVVLEDGVIQQLGTPTEIYERPANVFVSRFIGSPPMNILDVDIAEEALLRDGMVVPDSAGHAQKLRQAGHARVKMGVRPEKCTFVRKPQGDAPGLPGRVVTVEDQGAESVVGMLVGSVEKEEVVPAATSGDLQYAKYAGGSALPELGEPCILQFDLDHASWFDCDSGDRLEIA